uniref:Uncharacterized protein n=1 Tax=Steinernema glaseri TaxID=37863 RepID=A0A1I7ZCE4_9BILA
MPSYISHGATQSILATVPVEFKLPCVLESSSSHKTEKAEPFSAQPPRTGEWKTIRGRVETNTGNLARSVFAFAFYVAPSPCSELLPWAIYPSFNAMTLYFCWLA